MEIISSENKGFSNLSPEEKNVINQIKLTGDSLSKLVEKLSDQEGIDIHWVNIGKTDLQRGLMALSRAVAHPGYF